MFYNLTFPNYNFAHKYNENPLPNDEFEDHFHMIYELLFFIEGDAEFIIENKRFKLNSGDLLFITPGQHHNINVNPKMPYERFVIKFPEYDIPKQLLPIEKNVGPCYITDGTPIPELFRRIDFHVKNFKGNDLCGLLKCTLKEILYYSCSETLSHESETYNEKMKDVINFINENISNKLSLENICKRFHYSKSYICKEFLQCMNVPIMQYIRTKKILTADSLIKNGAKPATVFEQCGFTDYSTFFRAYKKLLKVSPSSKSKSSTPPPLNLR